MKTETKVADIQKHLAAAAATKAAKTAKTGAMEATERAIQNGPENTPSFLPSLEAARAAVVASSKAQSALLKVPKDRRNQAAQTVKISEEIGKAAARQGDRYSGDTSYRVKWGDSATAHTSTDRGDQYSRRCTYRKTDATHVVTLCPAGVVALVENESLRQASARDGLYLIDLRENGACVWVRAKGKAIFAESGWIAGNGSLCYHSTKSAEDARRGYERKRAAAEREAKLAREAGKVERRARLIARLCGSAIATLADAQRLGYCAPGIAAFQSRHGIGDTAPLPALIRTGDPSAVKLALSIARKISAKKTLATA
jgi:hypothetical protein